MRRELEGIFGEIHKAVVGNDDIIEKLLVSLFSEGHVLLVGVPGLAKTLMVRAFSKTLDLTFNRIQFTPDLMPTDITGTEIFRDGKFEFSKGPVFANVILADEINRAPPKTQSALLEVMQERRVTYGGKVYEVPKPFFVLATQNPIEQEGTYPLPEAQLDRFLMEIDLEYPSFEDEVKIAVLDGFRKVEDIGKVLSVDEILEIQREVREIPVPDHVIKYAVSLVRNTRPENPVSPKVVKEFVRYGAGPRASQFLISSSKALAFIRNKAVPTTEEVKELFRYILKHRIILHFRAEAEGVNVEEILDEVLKSVKADRF